VTSRTKDIEFPKEYCIVMRRAKSGLMAAFFNELRSGDTSVYNPKIRAGEG
jgi:hypothetical protein